MKKTLMVLMLVIVMLVGCAEFKETQRMQNNFFDKNGKKAGYSNEVACRRQAAKDLGLSYAERQTCYSKPACKELAEACLRGKGFDEAKSFENSEERMATYKRAYEEAWIKPGMTRSEVIGLLGAPQIITWQLIPPRAIWRYCRSTTKTALIGFNFVLDIVWKDDVVESVEKRFKI